MTGRIRGKGGGKVGEWRERDKGIKMVWVVGIKKKWRINATRYAEKSK